MIKAMQQTQNLKLNLIETDDPFSPSPLNENTEKIEAALGAVEDSLDARISILEAKKVLFGTYVGQNIIQTIPLDFTPFAVFVQYPDIHGGGSALTIGENKAYYGAGRTPILTIVENGFKIGTGLIADKVPYNFIAFG